MSVEISDQSLARSKLEPQKKSRISYTPDFLLSLSNLDACKKLPSGFNASILSEFEDAFKDTSERQQIHGGLSFQSLRHNDISLEPKYKTETLGDYSRGSSGRWEPRSSCSNNRNGDSDQGDASRRFGNQSRHSWQPPEHDGLLGSGAFPRTSGHVGPPAPRARATGPFQLNRSSEPYQPPRPYKALPFQRKENYDSRDDETFGSAECSSDDRAEEERKRRASFELLRKDQQKQLHGRQKQIAEDDRGRPDIDIIAQLDKSGDKSNQMQKHEKAEDCPTQNDNPRSTTVVQAPVSRPLVPPGFASSAQERSHCIQSSSPQMAPEAKLAVSDKLTLDATNNEQEKNNQFELSLGGSKISLLLSDSEKFETHSSDDVVLTHVSENSDPEDPCLQNGIVWKETTFNDVRSKREEKSGVIDSFDDDSSTSILDKLFGDSLLKSFGKTPTYSETEPINIDQGTWSRSNCDSSKFAQWFTEEEKKPEDEFLSKNMLSLIVNSEKSIPCSDLSSEKAVEHIIPTFNSEINHNAQDFPAPPANSLIVQNPVLYPEVDKPDSSPTVLTCEDLEQFILAEVKDNASSLEHPIKGTRTATDKKSEEPKVDNDDHASLHILSLLQKGTTEKDKPMTLTSVRLDTGPFDKAEASSFYNLGTETASHSVSEAPSVQKNLILEALFGSQFVDELHSSEAPVSTKRVAIDGISSTNMVQHGPSNPEKVQYETSNFDTLQSHASQFLYPDNSSNTGKLGNTRDEIPHYVSGPWIDNGSNIISGPKVGSAGSGFGALEVHLPQEDSLITGMPNQLTHLRNQPRVPFPELEQMSQQMKFISSEGIHHDAHLAFPANLIRPNAFNHVGSPLYDPSNSLMLPRMQIPSNLPRQIPVQSLQRGMSASHPVNQMQGYMPELSNMHHVPLHQQQPNYGGIGMGLTGPVGGGINHQEAFHRMVDMELRANQVRPAAAGHFPGIYGPDLESNLRYR